MKVGVVKESYPGEHRVALTPGDLGRLSKAGMEVVLEHGAGVAAGYPDASYTEKGASLGSRGDALACDIVVQVRSLGANPIEGKADLASLKPGCCVIGAADPLGNPQAIAELAPTQVRHFALELIPRITRAQSMDILSSMATIAGYRAVLLAANQLPKLMPMLTTAAGTISPARVFVIGAGVAGLQAIATSRRLGAIVQAYDLRPACREQVESVGGKFVELTLAADAAEDKGGYAKQMDEDFYRRQRELMAEIVAESDVVITTAAIPGRKSPLLVTEAAVQGMRPGGVIIDLAAERGGNCELTQADQRVEAHGVVILGPTNLPSDASFHASQMYSRNVTNFLTNLVKDGQLQLNLEDEIIRDTLVCNEGEVVHPRIREMLNLPSLPSSDTPEASEPPPASTPAEGKGAS